MVFDGARPTEKRESMAGGPSGLLLLYFSLRLFGNDEKGGRGAEGSRTLARHDGQYAGPQALPEPGHPGGPNARADQEFRVGLAGGQDDLRDQLPRDARPRRDPRRRLLPYQPRRGLRGRNAPRDVLRQGRVLRPDAHTRPRRDRRRGPRDRRGEMRRQGRRSHSPSQHWVARAPLPEP